MSNDISSATSRSAKAFFVCFKQLLVTVMDGHGHGHSDGRLKRSGTVRNEVKRNETVDHGHGTFSAKNERFTVTITVLCPFLNGFRNRLVTIL